MTPQPGLPDLVFTANAGPDVPQSLLQLAVSSRGARARNAALRRLVRGPRVHGRDVCRRACSSRGPATPCSAAEVSSPATASAATCRGISTSASVLHRQVLPLELVNPYFYHLDTCFCPLAPGEALYYPEAFDAYGRKVLEAHIPKLLAASEAEAHRFGCNAVVVGKTVVMNAGCDSLAADLQALGLHHGGGGTGRVHQIRRQRQVSDAAARRRRSRRVGLKEVLNHRDTETQRRQEEKRGEEQEEQNPPGLPYNSLLSSSLLCVSVSLWFSLFFPQLSSSIGAPLGSTLMGARPGWCTAP